MTPLAIVRIRFILEFNDQMVLVKLLHYSSCVSVFSCGVCLSFNKVTAALSVIIYSIHKGRNMENTSHFVKNV